MQTRGTLLAFAAFGVFWGAWGVLLPEVKEQTGASVGQLGVVLLCIGLAALPAMVLTGLLCDRFGPRVIVPVWNVHCAASRETLSRVSCVNGLWRWPV